MEKEKIKNLDNVLKTISSTETLSKIEYFFIIGILFTIMINIGYINSPLYWLMYLVIANITIYYSRVEFYYDDNSIFEILRYYPVEKKDIFKIKLKNFIMNFIYVCISILACYIMSRFLLDDMNFSKLLSVRAFGILSLTVVFPEVGYFIYQKLKNK
ncbi:hypothetical protein [Intestinibacter sp.]